jgi:acetylornithine/succinyldiaminopimelate/putrescine aminotransferase
MLLVFDEVQTGMGRTGNWFGYQTFGVQPDIMTMAKGIAAGVACGAVIAREEVAPALRPGIHASTFGGNPLAMSAGLATVQTIEEDGLLENVKKLSARFRQHFEMLQQKLPIIDEVRVCWMMIGIDLKIESAPAVKKCMERGLLINATHDTVVRLLPALNISEEDAEEGCAILTEVLQEMAEGAE